MGKSNNEKIRELSLFSGAGGGVLGSKILGWKTVGYVEFNGYCQKVIAQRIKDGIFDNAPIFGDVRTFTSDGYASSYKGMVDVVTGGFPCQPFSVAGARKAGDDSRDMWPATLAVINAVQPPIVFLENVPGLLSATMDDESGRPVYYFGEVLRDLAESGYDVKWCVLGADDVGAPHRRKRLWVLGVSTNPDIINKPISLDESKPEGSGKAPPKGAEPSSSTGGDDVGESSSDSWDYAYGVASWNIEPNMGRVANGVASHANRLKAIGNGQVPLTMAAAYAILSAEFTKSNNKGKSQ